MKSLDIKYAGSEIAINYVGLHEKINLYASDSKHVSKG